MARYLFWMILLVVALAASISWAVEARFLITGRAGTGSFSPAPPSSGGGSSGCTLPFTLPCTL